MPERAIPHLKSSIVATVSSGASLKTSLAPETLRSQRLFVTGLICIGLAASLAILFATARWGIGVVADSTVYVGAARSLLATGHLNDVSSSGQAVPLVHYPPLLPLTLGVMAWLFRIDPVSAARWLAAFLIAATSILFGIGVCRFLNSYWFGFAAALVMAIFTPTIEIHQLALSEPLFLFFATIAFFSLLGYLTNQNERWLIAAATATGFGLLTRYAGISVVIMAVAALALLQRKRFATVLRDVCIFGFISCSPMAAWVVRNHLVSGAPSDYSSYKLLDIRATLNTIWAGLNTLSDWLLPGNVPSPIRLAVLVVTVLVLSALYGWAVWRGKRSDRRFPNSTAGLFPTLAFFYIASYLVVITATILFLDGTTPFDDRILLPLFAPFVCLLLWAFKVTLTRGTFKAPVWVVPAVTLLLLFLTNAIRTPSYLVTTARSGRGYTAADWRNSNVIRLLKAVPPDVQTYATLPSSIRFLTDLQVRQVPNIYNPRNDRRNPNYDREISSVYREAKDPGIVLVYFRTNATRWYPSETDLVRNCNLKQVASDKRSTVYMSSNLVKQLALPTTPRPQAQLRFGSNE